MRTILHAYSETEFLNGDHETFFSLLSMPTPDLIGPTTHTLTLGPLPPGGKACYASGLAVSSGDEDPKLLELSGCVRVSGS